MRLRDLAGDPQVGAGVAHRLDRLAHALHATLGVRERPVLLGEGGRRQDHVRVLRRLGQEDVLHDQEVDLLHRLARVRRVGLAQGRVLAHEVDGLDPTARDAAQDLQVRQARRRRRARRPRPARTSPSPRARPPSGSPGRRSASAPMSHAPCTLLCPRSGFTPPEASAHVAGQQRQVADGQHVVGAVGVLGDPHGVEDARRRVLGVHARRLRRSARTARRSSPRPSRRRTARATPGTPRSSRSAPR